MNILMTSHSYLPCSDGVEFVNKYMAEGLVAKGNSVTIITYFRPDCTNTREEIINGVHVIRWTAFTKHAIHKGEKKEFVDFILKNQYKFDVIINVCTQTALTDWLFPVFDQIKIPMVLYVHSIWDFRFKSEDFSSVTNFIGKLWADLRWGIYYKRWKNVFQKYAAIIQLHKEDYAYKFFKKHYNINSYVIENAAENSFFEYKHVNVEKANPYILNVSNYTNVKNQIVLLKAFLQADIDNKWELTLIGSKKTKYCDRLVSYYSDYCLKNKSSKKIVKILYDIPRSEIYKYVCESSLYAMTSKWEGFPISIIEAMSAGKAFISSDVGVVRFLPGGAIYHNYNELVCWLEKLTSQDKNRMVYERMSKEYAFEHFRIEEKVNQLSCILQDVIRSKAAIF